MERQVMTPKQLNLIVKIVEKGLYPEVDTFAQALMGIYELPPRGASLLEQAIKVAQKNTLNCTNKSITKQLRIYK